MRRLLQSNKTEVSFRGLSTVFLKLGPEGLNLRVSVLSFFRLEESKGESKKLEHVVKLKDKKIEALESR